MSIESLKEDLEKLKNPEKAKILSGFFKTGKGEYGEGDIFLGLTVPQSREIAKKYFSLISIPKIQFLLNKVFTWYIIKKSPCYSVLPVSLWYQFIVNFTGNISELVLQEGELKAIKWVKYSSLKDHLIFVKMRAF